MEKLLALIPLVLVLACPLGMVLIGLVGWFIARTRKRPTGETAALVHSETGRMVQLPPHQLRYRCPKRGRFVHVHGALVRGR